MEYKFPRYEEMSKSVKDWVDHEASVDMRSWKKWDPKWVGRFIAMYWNEDVCHVGIIVSGTREQRPLNPEDKNSDTVPDVLIRLCTPVGDHKESKIWFEEDGANAFFIDEYVLLQKFNINVCLAFAET